MLFLVIDSINTKQIDAEQINQLKHTFGLYNDYSVEGKLKLCYAFADKPGMISVWDVESNEELQRILFLLPSLSIIDRKVKPLTELKSLVSVTGELQQIVSLYQSMSTKTKRKENQANSRHLKI